MNVVFRVDASVQMGTGHVMRCLTLANELKSHGANVSFICRTLEGHLCELIESEGYQVFRLPHVQNDEYIEKLAFHSHWLEVNWKTDVEQTIQIIKAIQTVDWLIIDHYAIEKHWEEAVRPYVKKIMVIDDLADRFHNCDLLLDQNYYENFNLRYDKLVPDHCKLLLGPKYALLRNEFRKMRSILNERSGIIKRLFVCFGGSDPTNETEKVLRAIYGLQHTDIAVDVIVGASNLNKEKIESICKNMEKVNFFYQVNNIAELMAKADFAIVSGGTITWERYCLGLVGGIITVASNQETLAKTVHDLKIDTYLGSSSKVSENDLLQYIKVVSKQPDLLKRRSLMAMNLVDGNGVSRVIRNMWIF
jgi:UDP-2,4-diacetamido-2,4,6-trideoxy-beta-L-altropyranose hydrolase